MNVDFSFLQFALSLLTYHLPQIFPPLFHPLSPDRNLTDEFSRARSVPNFPLESPLYVHMCAREHTHHAVANVP